MYSYTRMKLIINLKNIFLNLSKFRNVIGLTMMSILLSFYFIFYMSIPKNLKKNGKIMIL